MGRGEEGSRGRGMKAKASTMFSSTFPQVDKIVNIVTASTK